MRITLLATSFGPYHLARLRALKNQHEVQAIEVSRTDPVYGWDVHNEKVAADIVSLSHSRLGQARARTRLSRLIEHFSPDVVAIPGWSCLLCYTSLYRRSSKADSSHPDE